MTAKQYLSQIRSLKIRIAAMAEQIEFLRAAAECVTTTYSDMPRPATRNIHKNEDAIIRVLDMEERMRGAFNRLTEINEAIESLSDPTLHSLLVKRYVRGERWEQIAADLFVSIRQVHRLHQAALDKIEADLKVGT
ncbi:MAG: hypothetical protein FWF69_07675 [Firmicutes bacterium]|nr:hypothetical protein [Bacillota bacterium]